MSTPTNLFITRLAETLPPAKARRLDSFVASLQRLRDEKRSQNKPQVSTTQTVTGEGVE